MVAPIQAELDPAGTQILYKLDERNKFACRLLLDITATVSQTAWGSGVAYSPVSWPILVQLESLNRWYPKNPPVAFGPRLLAWKQQEIVRRVVAKSGELHFELPEGRTPYSWQRTAGSMIGQLGTGFFADDAGTGKTIGTLMGLRERQALHGDALPALIVCPKSVMESWVRAVHDWTPWQATKYEGTPAKRKKLAEAGEADVYVIGYDTMRIDADTNLPALKLKSLVLDECHAIKNSQSKRSKAARKLARKMNVRVVLSATPIEKGPDELWPALNAVDPASFSSRDRFIDRYCQVVSGYFKDEVVGIKPHMLPEYRQALAGVFRRVAKADVLTELPPKVYSTRYVEVPRAYQKVYKQLELDMLAELPSGEEIQVMHGIVLRTRLRQLASAPADVKVTEEPELDDEGIPTGNMVKKWHVRSKHTKEEPSWKIEALLEVLAERPGEPVVVFSHSRQLIDLAGAAAEEAGYRVGYIVGGRDDQFAFQDGKLDLICVTTSAGGVGVTLTRANTAVFLTRPEKLIESLQAEDRLHRIGAEKLHKSIEIIDIQARGTIDEDMPEQLRPKAGNLAEAIDDQRIVDTFMTTTTTGEDAA